MSSLPGKKAERELVDETAGVRFDAYENVAVKIGKYDKGRSTIHLDCQCEIPDFQIYNVKIGLTENMQR